MQGVQDGTRDPWSTVGELRHLLDRLIELAERLFPAIPQPVPMTDLYGRMALTFLCKQIEHARSLLALGRSRDVVLIARSMVEGMVQLTWASKLKGRRARRWCDFDAIQDWRTLDRRHRAGMRIPASVVAQAKRNARRLGWRFLTKDAAKSWRTSQELPPNPYVRSWSGLDIRELCKRTGYELKYLTFYADFSEWHHWGPTGLTSPLYGQPPESGVKAQITYECEDLRISEQALANGFQCLVVTLDLVNDHLKTGLDRELVSLAEAYMGTRGFATRDEDLVQAA